ncbi:MAG: phosphate acyltransferase PlsX [Myxococcota bacterium]
MQRLPIALDAMGADAQPQLLVTGAMRAAKRNIPVMLVGDEPTLKRCVQACGGTDLLQQQQLTIQHAEQVVHMGDEPSWALRNKRNSSMAVACQLVKSGQACAALSAGNSGAMMAFAVVIIGRVKGVLRPCIATPLPSQSGQTLLLDAGANTECSARHLAQFAYIGQLYMQQVFGVQKPRVGILANGEEGSKGNALTQQALQWLKQGHVNVVGHCEGNDLFSGAVDVVVCDGFVGNVVLKCAEGCARFLLHLLRDSYRQAGIRGKLGAALSAPVFRQLKKRIDPREFGAAPLLGLKGSVYITHGSADAHCIDCALQRLHADTQLPATDAVRQTIRQCNELLP